MATPKNHDIAKVADLCRAEGIDPDAARLGDEFYPNHLSIALIDAVFNANLVYDRVLDIVRRYCDRFDLQPVRQPCDPLPPVGHQETLSDLLDHYAQLGPDGFQTEIAQSAYISPGTWRCPVLKSENVRLAAIELCRIGIETLQDAAPGAGRAEDIKSALLPLPGVGHRTVNMFLMYAGHYDIVKGDRRLCRFTARALGRRKVSADEAEHLGRAAAKTLGIPPCLLDYEIWKLGADGGCKR